MNRYIAFLDILGFSDLVMNEDLAVVKQRISVSLQALRLAQSLGDHPKQPSKSFQSFSFSDTFVLVSQDDSPEAALPLILGAALLTQYLFAQGLPVRGAVTFGEADFIPGTNHLVGRGIIAAHALESRQDWLGVILDLPAFPEMMRTIADVPIVAPLFARWNVPLKDGTVAENAVVVNWRLNLVVEKGTRSLFRTSNDAAATRKIENTLAFVRHIRESNRHVCSAAGNDGKPLRIPFLSGCAVGTKDPVAFRPVHGDDL